MRKEMAAPQPRATDGRFADHCATDRGRRRSERGSALVEFALILPILVMLLLGIITGAEAYGQKLSLTNGAREGARYGATLPVSNFANINAWLDDVAAKSTSAVDGGLPAGLSGRATCVAYVFPNGTDTNDTTKSRRENSAGTVSYGTTSCFSDSRLPSERRIQVTLARNAQIDALLVRSTIGLGARSISRFEAIAG